MSDDLPEQPPACTNCGAPLHGPFCAQCGQERKPLDPPVRYFAAEFAQELFDVDRRILRSLRRLFFSPGFLTLEHFSGRRAVWVSPLKLYLSTSLVCFGVFALVGQGSGAEFRVTGGSRADGGDAGLEAYGFHTIAEMQAAAEAAWVTWMPRVMFVLVPLVAWLVARARRRSGRRYPAHLVFTLHLYAAAFGVRALTAAVGWALPLPMGAVPEVLAAGYSVGYTYVALRRAYGVGPGLAARDTAIVSAGAWLATMLGTAAIVSSVVVSRSVVGWLGV